MQVNDMIHGFQVKQIRPLDEIQAEMYEMVHEQTGARTIWLKRNDENRPDYSMVQFLKKDEGWTKTYRDFPKYDDQGQKYIYSVLERSDVSGFVKTINETAGPSGPVFIITNKNT